MVQPYSGGPAAVALVALLANALIAVQAVDYECPEVCNNIAGQVFPCQDLRGSFGSTNKCYNPDGAFDSAGVRKCNSGLYDCRNKPAIPPGDMCANCIIGMGPCRGLINSKLCRSYDYLKDPPVCPTNFMACVDETTTATVTTATVTTVTTTTATLTTSTASTTTTTTTIRQCEFESIAGWGPCIFELENEQVIRFLAMPNGECIDGLFNCKETTTSTMTTTTATSTTTNSLCNEPCASGTFGDCRNPAEELGGTAECGAPDGIHNNVQAQCHSDTTVDCRPQSFTNTYPTSPFTCDVDACESFSVNGLTEIDDYKLLFVRGSFGHCKHPESGVCMPYKEGGGCWPGTVSCAEETKCKSENKKKTCCSCAASEKGGTSGSCKHPATGICMNFIKNTQECFPGTEACV